MKQQDKRQGALWKSVAGAASSRWRAAGCLFLALVLGVIPPSLIFVRAHLIDGALSVCSGIAAFLLVLALFCALYFLQAAGQALLEHALLVRSSRRGAALDRARAQKSAAVLYAETEKPSFRPLLERAKQAPEADAERFRALCSFVRLAVELVLSAAALAVYDVWAALGILRCSCSSAWRSTVRSRQGRRAFGCATSSGCAARTISPPSFCTANTPPSAGCSDLRRRSGSGFARNLLRRGAPMPARGAGGWRERLYCRCSLPSMRGRRRCFFCVRCLQRPSRSGHSRLCGGGAADGLPRCVRCRVFRFREPKKAGLLR